MRGLFVLLALTIPVAAQILPTNAAPPGLRTGKIVGEVVEAATGAPVPEASLPPGEYFLATPTDLETGEWNDPALLEQLVAASAKVTLKDGEMTKQDCSRRGGAMNSPGPTIRP